MHCSSGRRHLLCFSLVIASAAEVEARTITVTNACSYTIWCAHLIIRARNIFTDPTANSGLPDTPTGWEAPPSSSVSFSVPDNWASGRIWGRSECNFNATDSGPNSCLTGGCNGGLECDKASGTGVPPATLAEWTLQASGNNDFYDVSLVDGFNLPLTITPSATTCHAASCPVDLNTVCPSDIAGPRNSSGAIGGCKSACFANLDGNPSDSANCCSGSHGSAATCPPTGVAFYSFFKGNCPDAYAYPFDEGSSTALWTCNATLNADYTVTFCP
ncbi:thaumatin-like protein [Peniophora sp. CONT]|nr:thaumatin-like protein [Peniophora sp. CONT]